MKSHWTYLECYLKKKRFRANQTDLTSSKVQSVSQAGILGGIGELQLPWWQKKIQSWGPGNIAFPALAGQPPKQHFQWTVKIPMLLQGLA